MLGKYNTPSWSFIQTLQTVIVNGEMGTQLLGISFAARLKS